MYGSGTSGDLLGRVKNGKGSSISANLLFRRIAKKMYTQTLILLNRFPLFLITCDILSLALKRLEEFCSQGLIAAAAAAARAWGYKVLEHFE